MGKNLDTLRDRYLLNRNLAIYCFDYDEKIELLEKVRYYFLNNEINNFDWLNDFNQEKSSYVTFQRLPDTGKVRYYEEENDEYINLYLSPKINTLTYDEFSKLLDYTLYDKCHLFSEKHIIKSIAAKNIKTSHRIYLKGYDSLENDIALNNFNMLLRKYHIRNSLTINKFKSHNIFMACGTNGDMTDLPVNLSIAEYHIILNTINIRFLNDFYLKARLNPIYTTISKDYRME